MENPLLVEHGRCGPVRREELIRTPLVRDHAYGIPNQEALDAIAEASPAGVVEVGAGTGYWARLLHDRGVDVLAFDLRPASTGTNHFVNDASWFRVEEADATVAALHPARTLLLVWPTKDEAWAADASSAFHAAGGTTLVYVGEGPGGATGDAALHAQLGMTGACLSCSLGVVDVPCTCGVGVLWSPVRAVDIPRWADCDDRCTVYARSDIADPALRPRARWRPSRRRIRSERA